MKYICLGYFDETRWVAMSESERNAYLDECFAYDDVLRKNGHWVGGGEALQSARNAVTLRWKDGKVSVTDGPYAETKEQLGGFGVFEATDLNHAIQLMSNHHSLKAGIVEIRAAEDLTEMIRQSSGGAQKDKMNKQRSSKSGYAYVNDLKMYYEILGTTDGKTPPLVLFHGGGSTIDTTFAKVLPLLAKTRQVIQA
jgi:hypothetical protein